jgi:UDP-3-O-[3-hydroxymyristoyl] N-acetylglucosamine deacetylase
MQTAPSLHCTRKYSAHLKQTTLSNSVSFEGIGVHSGKPVRCIVHPSDTDTGYIFQRTDRVCSPVFGRYDNVTNTQMCTVISNEDGISISTVEHLLAALHGCGITNAYIELDGPEVPIMDGSSYLFAQAFQDIKKQRGAYDVLYVKKPFVFKSGKGKITVLPSKSPHIMMTFDGYSRMDRLLTKRYAEFRPFQDSFLSLISDARTFGFYEDGVKLKEQGLAQGASLDNTIVINQDETILNPEGLRSVDEFVRHKLLDFIGDVALAGVQIHGTLIGCNTSHSLNNQFLRAFMHAYDYWE